MATSKKNVAKKVSAPKTSKKATKVVAKKKGEAIRLPWMKGETGCDVDEAIKLMKRPSGATRADLNKADFRQASMSAIATAKNRGYKTDVKKIPGERTVYKVTGSAKA
jgi:hypothetical protein